MSILSISLANLTDQLEERNRIGGGNQGIVKVNLNPVESEGFIKY
jgi:hypothetical protein